MYLFISYVLSNFSRVRLFAILWSIARQAPLSMEFSRQEHWSGLPCPPLGDLPDPGVEPGSPGLRHCRRILSRPSRRGSPRLLPRLSSTVCLVAQLCPAPLSPHGL